MFTAVLPHLFQYRDTCGVYVLRHGDRALLVDGGSGAVLDHLGALGIRQVDWVLYTHHHREQCQGHARFAAAGIPAAAPAAERAWFADPAAHLPGEDGCLFGSPYVRPPRDPVAVERWLGDGDELRWGPFSLRARLRPGDSPGALVYTAEIGGRRVAFTGDLLREDARLHNFYDSEWDYGWATGLSAQLASLRALAAEAPELACSAHGAVLDPVLPPLQALIGKLERFIPLCVRHYGPEDEPHSRAASRPTSIPAVRQVSPHLFAFTGRAAHPNCYLLLSAAGAGLIVDPGVLGLGLQYPQACAWLDEQLEAIRREFGLTRVEAAFITHYHGDHYLQARHLAERHGTEIWAYENYADIVREPRRFNLPATLPYYRLPHESTPVHRILREGEVVRWKEYAFRVFHCPGQTVYAAALQGEIDGRVVAFTGDNLFYSGASDGHEAFVVRNGGLPAEGYLQCARDLTAHPPDLILAGHGMEIDAPAAQLRLFRQWAEQFDTALRELSPYPDYEYFLDPHWVTVDPYWLDLAPGESRPAEVVVRSHRDSPAALCLEFRGAAGLSIEPRTAARTLLPRETVRIPVRITAAPSIPRGYHRWTQDVTLDGVRWGEVFDAMVRIA